MLRSLGLYVLLLFAVLPLHAGEFDRGMLWEIQQAGKPASYLLGTIHSDDPSVTRLPAAVQNAFNRSRSFSAELDMDMNALLQAQMLLMLPPEKSLQSMIGATRYRQCVQLMQNYGVPEMMVDRMKPWAIAAQLGMPKPRTGIFLDLQLYQQAQQKGMAVHGLETIEEQMSVFDGMTNEQQIAMLDQAIRDHAGMPRKIAKLIQLYKQRDLKGLQSFSAEEMKRVDRSLSQVVEKKLINERNVRMVQRMQPRLDEGQAFIAVGALHLPGDEGLLSLLKEKGYRLRALY